MRHYTILIFLLLAQVVCGQPRRALIWSDEFDGAKGSSPDPAKWAYDLGGGGWGNAELESYTTASENVMLDGRGNLLIRAIKTPSGGYTSGRIKTQGKFDVTYGRIEARIKIPQGQGVWPAFWMLGSDIGTVGWPMSGEIDIMENIGREPGTVHGSVHGPGYSGDAPITAAYSLPGGKGFSDDFHVFAIDWTPSSVEFFVDSQSYQKVLTTTIPQGSKWVFNKPLFLLLNVAIGGTWPGNPDNSTQFPQEMTIDYVRVFQIIKAPTISEIGVLNAASLTSAVAPGSVVTIFGTGLANVAASNLFDASLGSFVKSSGTTVLTVSGILAPLIYVSPEQINFQIPWEAPTGVPVSIQVSHDDLSRNTIVANLAETAPAAFAATGVAILSCVGGKAKPGAPCVLWGNGFGPKQTSTKSGVPAGSAVLPLTTNACTLAIGGIQAMIAYCGAAPGLIIDQLNFVYPEIPADSASILPAVLAIGSANIELRVPVDR